MYDDSNERTSRCDVTQNQFFYLSLIQAKKECYLFTDIDGI